MQTADDFGRKSFAPEEVIGVVLVEVLQAFVGRVAGSGWFLVIFRRAGGDDDLIIVLDEFAPGDIAANDDIPRRADVDAGWFRGWFRRLRSDGLSVHRVLGL